MRIGVYRGLRTLAIEEAERPTAEPQGAVLAVTACGICGSDLHAYTHGSWIEEGMQIGHEYAGEIVEVGAEVTGLEPGDRVAVMPLVPCRTCFNCVGGRTNLCEAPGGAMGGFADLASISRAARDESLFVMPDDLSDEAGAWLEPLAVSVRAVNLAAADLDEPVVVLGLGAIGQGVVAVLASRGARRIIGVDISPLRLEAARAAGAHLLLNAAEVDVYEAVREDSGTTMSPYQPLSAKAGAVIECSGAAASLDLSLELARPGGTVVFVALAGHKVQFDLDKAVQKELRVQGSFAYRHEDTAEAFRLIADHRVDVTSWVTHSLPLEDLTAAFEQQLDKDTSIKVMVRPGART